MKCVLVGTILNPKDPNGIVVDIAGAQVPLSQAVLEHAATNDQEVVAAAEACIAQAIAAREIKAAVVPPRADAR